jgi:hypothetical protein
MWEISWLAEKLSFSRRTLLHGMSERASELGSYLVFACLIFYKYISIRVKIL